MQTSPLHPRGNWSESARLFLHHFLQLHVNLQPSQNKTTLIQLRRRPQELSGRQRHPRQRQSPQPAGLSGRRWGGCPQPHIPCESPRQPWLDAGLLCPGLTCRSVTCGGWAGHVGFLSPWQCRAGVNVLPPRPAPPCLLHSCALVLRSGSPGTAEQQRRS